MPLSESQRADLLDIARRSIEYGLHQSRPLTVQATDYPALDKPGACFVTLHRHGELRGCIGSLEAYRPLVNDVAENAYAAAFRDPRFLPLQDSEMQDLTLDVSVLSSPEAIDFRDEADLVEQLRPGIDGVIIEESPRRGTFLPSVWEGLPDKTEFLRHLKVKAGLPADYWSDSIRAWRYTTEIFGE
jgi:AmmeMemoRadiSam system protein A